MIRPPVAIAVAALLAAPASADAGRLAAGSAQLHALAVGADGRALAVVDSGTPAAPFRLVRGSGRGRRHVGLFGGRTGEMPDVASDARGALVSWARPISGGAELSIAPVLGSRLGRAQAVEHAATGPGRLGTTQGAPVLAFPDETGDVALRALPPRDGGRSHVPPRRERLTRDAPATRHHPLGVAFGGSGPLVLDVAQRRRRTSLVVLGQGAPRSPVVVVPAVRHLGAGIAASGGLVAVAYYSRGRAVVATARDGGPWARRRLPGAGGGVDAPVPVIDGGRVRVAYVQRVGADREVVIATLGSGRPRARLVTRNRADERGPRAATGPRGELYVGWTRRAPGSDRHVPMIRRIR